MSMIYFYLASTTTETNQPPNAIRKPPAQIGSRPVPFDRLPHRGSVGDDMARPVLHRERKEAVQIIVEVLGVQVTDCNRRFG